MDRRSDLGPLDALPLALMVVESSSGRSCNLALQTLLESEREADALRPVIGLQPGQQAWIRLAGADFLVVAGAWKGGVLLAFIPVASLASDDPTMAAMRREHEELREILQNGFDGIYVADGEGRTLWLNPGFERAYGLSGADFIGRDARELERLGFIRPLITWKVITTRQRQTALQRTKSGRSVLATGVPLFDAQGNVRRVIINSRDLTELLELQEKLTTAETDLARARSELARLRKAQGSVPAPVHASPVMATVIDLARRLAPVDSSVLIEGESGVGKDVIARLLHAEGPRRSGPFMKVNCGAIPADLLESELFGYAGGAFSGARREGKPGLIELAQGGTLFLDEIGEMPLALQVKLLQVLQDRSVTRLGATRAQKVDFRLVAATNQRLREMVAARRFREDLFYRLSVVPMRIPPLRERREDIPPIANHMLEEVNAQYGLKRKLSGTLMRRLIAYDWPGNVRELRNAIERLAVTAEGDLISAQALPEEFASSPAEPAGENLRAARQAREAALVRAAMQRHGSLAAAAAALGISLSTAKRRLRNARGQEPEMAQ